MDSSTKTILIVAAAALLLVLLLGTLVGLYLFRAVRTVARSGGGVVAVSPQAPGIVTGAGGLSQSVFLEDGRLGSVSDITIGELDPSPGTEIGVAGSQGALFLDEDGNVKSAVSFGARTVHVDIIDVENDGVCEFMDRGSWGVPASVMDHQGQPLWTYGGRSPGVNDMAAGDIDGDGSLEYIVGFNGGGGVHLVETDGTRLWRQPEGNVWHVEMLDTDGDGSLEIVHSNAGGQMTVRDSQGAVVTQARPGPYFSGFSICRWPTAGSSEHALLAEDDTIWLFDFAGDTVAELSAPQCGTLGHARGVPVRLQPGQPEHFAVAVDFKRTRQAILYVYDSAGALVYQEVLPESCRAIAALPLAGGQAEALLVGGEGKVLRYEPAPAAAAEE